MFMGNTPGVVGYTKTGTTIAIHPIVSSVDEETKTLETSHGLTIYSLMNERKAIQRIVDINMSKDSLEILLECVGNYLEMLEDEEALKQDDGRE